MRIVIFLISCHLIFSCEHLREKFKTPLPQKDLQAPSNDGNAHTQNSEPAILDRKPIPDPNPKPGLPNGETPSRPNPKPSANPSSHPKSTAKPQAPTSQKKRPIGLTTPRSPPPAIDASHKLKVKVLAVAHGYNQRLIAWSTNYPDLVYYDFLLYDESDGSTMEDHESIVDTEKTITLRPGFYALKMVAKNHAGDVIGTSLSPIAVRGAALNLVSSEFVVSEEDVVHFQWKKTSHYQNFFRYTVVYRPGDYALARYDQSDLSDTLPFNVSYPTVQHGPHALYVHAYHIPTGNVKESRVSAERIFFYVASNEESPEALEILEPKQDDNRTLTNVQIAIDVKWRLDNATLRTLITQYKIQLIHVEDTFGTIDVVRASKDTFTYNLKRKGRHAVLLGALDDTQVMHAGGTVCFTIL